MADYHPPQNQRDHHTSAYEHPRSSPSSSRRARRLRRPDYSLKSFQWDAARCYPRACDRLFVVYALAFLVLRRTTFAHTLSLSATTRSGLAVGVNVNRIKVATYVVAGRWPLLAASCRSRGGDGDSRYGVGLPLSDSDGGVLGGASLTGGAAKSSTR